VAGAFFSEIARVLAGSHAQVDFGVFDTCSAFVRAVAVIAGPEARVRVARVHVALDF